MSVYRNREGVLVDRENRIAMQWRDNKPGLPAANQWGLFGGLSMPHEEPQSVAIREIQEELSVALHPEKLHLLQQHYLPEQNLTTWVYGYLVTNELDHAILREGQAWDFIGEDDVRVGNIGLHHHEMVLAFWRGDFGDCLQPNTSSVRKSH